MTSVLNISAYLFVPLHDLQDLRQRIHAQAASCDLRGTVLLAEEGINLFLAGWPWAVRHMIAWLQQDPRFKQLTPKESQSSQVPFDKLRVKIKHEIIRMNHPCIQPAVHRAPAVAAQTLNRWLSQGHDDEGRCVVMLDTRNSFEIEAGHFKNALNLGLSKFSEFPQAISKQREALQGKTVVSYCTGGIRCEKAALFMADMGMDHILQLEGGILKYFEEVGDQHFEGHCFVFDQRNALHASELKRLF
jgi:UPF0176 protein